MDFKKGNWNVEDPLDLDKASELLDDKVVKNVADDIRRQMAQANIKSHKPLLVPSNGLPPPNKNPQYSRLISGDPKQQISKNPSGAALASPKAAPIRAMSKDGDLMSQMTKRLTQLEAVNKSLKLEIRELSEKNFGLKAQNDSLRLLTSLEAIQQLETIKKERDRYKKQCDEMVKFLKDYGLNWVGGEGGQHEGSFDKQAINDELKFQGPAFRNNLPKEIDTDVLSRRIEELNFIAEKQRMATIKGNMHGLVQHADVPIFFYQNGLMIKGFPFYPYYSKQAQSVLSDILDGYFPYDLKMKYPEGVPLKPVDLCDEVYNSQSKVKNEKIKMLGEYEQPDQPMSKKQFLDQFPEKIIKNGEVVKIREDLEKRFGETQTVDVNKLNSNEPIVPKTHVADGTEGVCRLRIRTETGLRQIILTLLPTDTLTVVYKYVKPYIENAGKKFELYTNFPVKGYAESLTGTLKELGLAPSCVLIVKLV